MSAVMTTDQARLPPGPIGGPAAWTGPALDAGRDWVHQFTPVELDELDAAIRQHVAAGRAMGELSPATFALPTLAKTLAALLDEVLHGRGFVMLRGFPVAHYGNTESAIA